jgi:hypothetical protein
MQQVKEVARKWQDAGRSSRDAAAGMQQQDAAGRNSSRTQHSGTEVSKCLDAQLCKFLSAFKLH